jgi:hypothetical protein
MMTITRFLPVLFAAAAAASAQNCAAGSTGRIPLDDLGAGSYLGFQGGLYPGGANARPAAHEAAGLAAAAAIVPRLADGSVAAQNDPAGRIVLLSIGMSNATQEFSTFVPTSNADGYRNPRVVVVDGAQGGQTASIIANPNANFWTVIQNRLTAAGVTPQQVGACWLKEANAGPTQAFPQDAVILQADLRTVCQNIKAKYANARICYVSSRIYAGYATTTLNPEPFAYQSGFAVKWLIESQINGDPGLNWDPAAGPVTSPWIAWGPYPWADGLTPRSDGLTWACHEYSADGTHPGVLARFKVAAMLDGFLRTDTTSVPWYTVTTPHSVRAAVFAYGSPCPGVAGSPNLVVPATPVLGAPAFSIGVTQGRPNATATVFASLAYDDFGVGGSCRAYVDAAQIFLPDAVTSTTFATNAAGSGFWTTPIPNVPSAMGLSVWAQIAVWDPAGAAVPQLGGAALTRAVRLILGTP